MSTPPAVDIAKFTATFFVPGELPPPPPINAAIDIAKFTATFSVPDELPPPPPINAAIDIAKFTATFSVPDELPPPPPIDSAAVRQCHDSYSTLAINNAQFSSYIEIDDDVEEVFDQTYVDDFGNDDQECQDDEEDIEGDYEGQVEGEPLKFVDRKGLRQSGADMKEAAVNAPLFDVLHLVCTPCNKACCLSGFCLEGLTCKEVLDERVNFWGLQSEPAPNDSQRAKKLVYVISKRTETRNGNLVFRIGDRLLCAAAYARMLGLSKSVDLKNATGQFKRLIKGHLEGASELDQLASEHIKLDRNERFTVLKGLQKSFISFIAEFFADTLPAAKSQEGHVNIRVLPYKSIRDLYREFEYQCITADTPLTKGEYGSYSSFRQSFHAMYGAKLVQLLGGKGGFQTCAICNHCLALKKAAAGRRDRVTIDLIRILQP
jgi:hypothetical protein